MGTDGEDARPVWLLDVDGVLNAATPFPERDAWPEWSSGWAVAAGSRWPIRWAPPVVTAIRHVIEHGLADVRWLTTWLDDANESLGPLLGLPALPVVPRPADRQAAAHGFLGSRAGGFGGWWKLAAARALLDPQPHRPLVWTDDDLVWEPDAVAWAEGRQAPTLLIAPETDVGLTAESLAAVVAFCLEPAAWNGP